MQRWLQDVVVEPVDQLVDLGAHRSNCARRNRDRLNPAQVQPPPVAGVRGPQRPTQSWSRRNLNDIATAATVDIRHKPAAAPLPPQRRAGGMHVAGVSLDSSTVAVAVVAKDAESGRLVSRSFQGTRALTLVDGAWKLDTAQIRRVR
jgi:hypothetical protein